MATHQSVAPPAVPSEAPAAPPSEALFEVPSETPPVDDCQPRFPSAFRRLAGTLVAAAVDEARNTAASVLIGGIVWWLTHR